MTYSSEVLALSPVQYLRLGEASGTVAADASTGATSGAYSASGVTYGLTGAVADANTSIVLNGAASISAGDYPADGATTFSWTGWVKPLTAGGFRTLFSKFTSNNQRFEISLGTTGNFGTDLGLVVITSFPDNATVGYVFTGDVLTLSQWSFVSIVFDGAQAAADRIRIYVNGSLQLQTVSGAPPTSLATMAVATSYIGARQGTSAYWHGGLDDVALFNSALTAGQITALYSSAVSSGPVTVTSAVVHASGAKIDLVLSASTTLFASNIAVNVNGYPMKVSDVSGSGTAWAVNLGKRWIRAGTTVAVVTGAASTAATNNSIITDAQIRYAGRQFGMFIHWNIETFLGVEWSTGAESINAFSPTQSVAAGIDQWIAAAIAADMKYMVLTSKHHGGFCLWPSVASARNLTNTTWYGSNAGVDIVRLFVDKVRAAGLGVGLYFSVWDRWWETNGTGTYAAFAQAQLTELLTNYGPIDLVWTDGWGWSAGGGVSFTTIPYATLYNTVKTLQPRCQLVVNNHLDSLSSSDILIYELGQVSNPIPAGNLYPAEVCDTIRIDNNWFWKVAADSGLTSTTILADRSTVNSRRGSYLLNCSPATDARMPDSTVNTLVDLGAGLYEAPTGNSVLAGTAAQRTVALTLTTDGTTPAANLTGLRWSFWEHPTPNAGSRPASQGGGKTTSGTGALSIAVTTRLAPGGIGWLVVTDSDGTTSQSPSAKVFSGPVTVA